MSSALPRQATARRPMRPCAGKAPHAEVKAGTAETGLTRSVQWAATLLRARRPAAGHLRSPAEAGVRASPQHRLHCDPDTTRRSPPRRSEGQRRTTARGQDLGSGYRVISLRQIEVAPQITRNFPRVRRRGARHAVDTARSGALGTGATNVYIDGVGQRTTCVRAEQPGTAEPISDPRSRSNQDTVGYLRRPLPRSSTGIGCVPGSGEAADRSPSTTIAGCGTTSRS